jgi:membrane protein
MHMATSRAHGARRSSGAATFLTSTLTLLLANVVAGAISRRPRPRGKETDPEKADSLEGERSAVIAQKRTSPLQQQRAQEPGRGREADTPSAIPARGWKDIAWRVYAEINDDRVVTVAAGVTFYVLLALFPGVGALVALYGLLADAATINDHLAGLAVLLPGGAIEVVGDQIKRITAEGSSTLGTTFFVGLAVSLWSANAGMKAIFDALNIVYDEVEKRSFIKLNALSLVFTLGAILFLLAAMGAMVVLPIVLDYVWLGQAAESLLKILRWPALLVAVMFGLSLLYRYGPSRATARWRWVTWGSVLAAILWIAISMLFSWYAANYGNYNKTYGSLGAIIGFMTWIWISTIVILAGAELNSEMEHQTARDTTTGPEKPLGARGATMADTVGAARA